MYGWLYGGSPPAVRSVAAFLAPAVIGRSPNGADIQDNNKLRRGA